MKRYDAIRSIVRLGEGALFVAANGMTSRELYSAAERPENFYMIGSMGLASSIGLGLALARPTRRVVVLDGDGNLLMNLGTLANVAAAAPPNYYHVVLDNGVHDSTGAQKTVSSVVPLEKTALACGYRRAFRVDALAAIEESWRRFAGEPGPAMLLVVVEPGSLPGVSRVEIEPRTLARRFREAALGPAAP